MKSQSKLIIEFILIVLTMILCSFLLTFNTNIEEFNSSSWKLVSSKLLSIQNHCRNSRAVRQTSDSIELIGADGHQLILSIEDYNNEQILKFERRSLTTIKNTTIVRNLRNLSLDFKKASEGLPNQDLSLKALYFDDALVQPLAILIDLSLSNPRLPQELGL